MKGREPRGFLIGFRKFPLQHPCVALLLAIESSCDETAVAIVRGEVGGCAEILASEI